MRTAVAQFGPVADPAANLAAIRGLVDRAAGQGAALVVLPEEAMLLAEAVEGELAEVVAATWPLFLDCLAELAVDHRLTIVAGGYEPSGTARPYNTLVVVGPGGEQRASYRKLHLYDAFAYQESDYVIPGADLPPVVEVDGVRVGLVNCYDIRFPELARSLVDRGADLLTVSAAWVDGPLKLLHWDTLNRCRAIENTVWLAASGSISEGCIGGSQIISPLGETKASLGDQASGVAVVDIDLELTRTVRTTLPALDNRRIALTYEVVEHS